MWDQNTAAGRAVRHQQLSSTVETLPTEAERSEMMGRTVKGHQSEGRLCLMRGGKAIREKNKGKGDVTEIAKWF